jgi:hypothetical protein
MFLYLRQLTGKLSATDPAWGVPWIGVDQSKLAQIVLFLTFVCLPTAAARMLCGQVLRQVGTYDVDGRVYYQLRPLFSLHSIEHLTALGKLLLAGVCTIGTFILGIRSWIYRPIFVPPEPVLSCPPQIFE